MAFAVSCGQVAHAHSACSMAHLERLPYLLKGCSTCWGSNKNCPDCKGKNRTEFLGCPYEAINHQTRSAITAFMFLNRFSLYPGDGGLYSQTAAFVRVVEILSRDLNESEQEK